LRNKVLPRVRAAADQFERGVAVVQENDAVVPQVAQGVLDVTHDLLVGVKPVDQGDVDGALLEEGRLVGEEVVAGRLEVVGAVCLRVGKLAGALREFERRVDGDLHVGADSPERLPFRNPDLQIDGVHPPLERPLHGLDPVRTRQSVRHHDQPVVEVHATILSPIRAH
jgi:hypothetical protein